MHTSSAGTGATTRIIWPDDDPDDPKKWAIRIDLNAAYFWPLLVQQYSVSEKTAISFALADLILHELAVSWNHQKRISIVASADETTAQHAARCK